MPINYYNGFSIILTYFKGISTINKGYIVFIKYIISTLLHFYTIYISRIGGNILEILIFFIFLLCYARIYGGGGVWCRSVEMESYLFCNSLNRLINLPDGSFSLSSHSHILITCQPFF